MLPESQICQQHVCIWDGIVHEFRIPLRETPGIPPFAETTGQSRVPVHVLFIDGKLVVEVSERPKGLRFREDEVRGAVDHFEEAEGAITSGGQTGWCNATVEAHGRNGLSERQLVLRWVSEARELAKDLVIGL